VHGGQPQGFSSWELHASDLGRRTYNGKRRWRDHDDWDRHRWQNNPAQPERWRQEQQNAALYRQQVQQNRQIYQQNLVKYNQQGQENRATYQRQLTEARQKKAPGQQ
jgi:hypothetical protein